MHVQSHELHAQLLSMHTYLTLIRMIGFEVNSCYWAHSQCLSKLAHQTGDRKPS